MKFHSLNTRYVKSAHLRAAGHKTWTFENILREVMVAGRVCSMFTGHQKKKTCQVLQVPRDGRCTVTNDSLCEDYTKSSEKRRTCSKGRETKNAAKDTTGDTSHKG